VSEQRTLQVRRRSLSHEETEGETKPMKVKHIMKSWVGLFEPLSLGLKKHEFRVMDRDFRVGDLCRIREFEPVARKYTGRYLEYEITYITSAKHQQCAFSPNALHPGMAVLSVKILKIKP
jgi:hypothetical protein